MPKQALFAGLVVDEQDQAADIVYIGEDPCYVVDDDGFRLHISSEIVDRQVLQALSESIEGHEDLLSEQTAKMLGAEDPFSFAMIRTQLEHIGQQLDVMLQTGIPEEVRAYLGMMGFRIKINVHGDVLEVVQPGMISGDDE